MTFADWLHGIVSAGTAPSWARSIDTAREIFETHVVQDEHLEHASLEPLKPSHIKCQVTRRSGIETVSVPRRGPRMIHGIAATTTISSKGNCYNPNGCQVRMPIPLLSAHNAEGRIGEVVLVRKSDRQIYVQAVLDDTRAAAYAWSLVQDGTLRALSVGTNPITKTVVEGTRFYDRWLLREVSLVRIGANADACCEPMT